MIQAFANFIRNVVNPGEKQLNIPNLDGPWKPNNCLDDGDIVAEVPLIDNLCKSGENILFSSENRILSLSDTGDTYEVSSFSKDVSALESLDDGGLVVGLNGGGLCFVGGENDGLKITEVDGRNILCPTDIARIDATTLCVSEGSRTYPPEDWVIDLMSKNKCGRVVKINISNGRGETLLDDLAFPAGLCVDVESGTMIVTQAWKHSVQRFSIIDNGSLKKISELADLPGYPGRISHSSDGGYWLAVFAMRTMLVEFVLIEDEYRESMMQEIEKKYWIAPALATLNDYRVPVQAGGLKQLGMVKPWSAPLSYGMVVKLNEALNPVLSLHSRSGSDRHGITSVLEIENGILLSTSKGNGKLIRNDLDACRRRE